MEPISRAVPPSAPALSSLPISAAILPPSPPSFLPTGTERCTPRAGSTAPRCSSGLMWSSGGEEPKPCFSLLCAPFSFEDAGDTWVCCYRTAFSAQGSRNVPRYVSVPPVLYYEHQLLTPAMANTLLPLTSTPIYISLHFGFLIVNSVSRNPLWSTITVAILTVENKTKVWMELNEFSNPKLPSAISLCYDTEIKPHSWHTKELSTRPVSLHPKFGCDFKAITHEEEYQTIWRRKFPPRIASCPHTAVPKWAQPMPTEGSWEGEVGESALGHTIVPEHPLWNYSLVYPLKWNEALSHSPC